MKINLCHKFPNGAMVIDSKEGVVLAIWQKTTYTAAANALFTKGGMTATEIAKALDLNLCMNITEFVTWRVDDEGNPSGGNYFQKLRDAVDDFEKRK